MRRVHQRYEKEERKLRERLGAGQLSQDDFRRYLRKAREEFALELPRYDPLTGLPERPLLYLSFLEMVRQGETAGVTYSDLNNLKDYNRNFAQEGGDLVVIAMAIVVERIAEKHHGFCVRYGFGGGDDFATLYTGKDADDLVGICRETERLLGEETTLDNLMRGEVCGQLVTKKRDGRDVRLMLASNLVDRVRLEKPSLLEIITPLSRCATSFIIKAASNMKREDVFMLLQREIEAADERVAAIKTQGLKEVAKKQELNI